MTASDKMMLFKMFRNNNDVIKHVRVNDPTILVSEYESWVAAGHLDRFWTAIIESLNGGPSNSYL